VNFRITLLWFFKEISQCRYQKVPPNFYSYGFSIVVPNSVPLDSNILLSSL
jgi:hypothetical protein